MWGRQVRPGSLALSLVTGALGINGVLGNTTLTGWWETIAGIIALTAAVALWAGWWQQCLRCALTGYLLSVWTWTVTAATAATQLGLAQTTVSASCWGLLAGLLWLRDRREQ